MANASAEQPSVLVVGAGAIGALYGSVLARRGAQVSVVCRSDYDAVSRHGYGIQSKSLGDHIFKPERVLREVADCKRAPDFLILTVKVLEGIDRAALIRPAVGSNTAIMLIENGIDIEPEIIQAFPENEVLSCLAFVGVSRAGEGRIEHQSYGHLAFGKFPAGVTPKAKQLATLWEAGGIACRVTENVVTARWQKAVWNAVFNPLSILGGTLTTAQMLHNKESEDFVRRGMLEVCAVAAAVGHPLAPDIAERHIAGTRAMPPYKTSMALDYENGRPMEIEAILGNVVRAGRGAAVPMPVLEALYAVVKMTEHKVRQQ